MPTIATQTPTLITVARNIIMLEQELAYLEDLFLYDYNQERRERYEDVRARLAAWREFCQ